MSKLKEIENREKNTRLELSIGFVALVVSLVFVFSNHIGYFYQIYYVIVVFATHQIIQSIIFNRWDFGTNYNSRKIWLRIFIIFLVLTVAFLDLGKIDLNYSNYFGFKNDKPRNTFLSVAIYSGIYLIIYIISLKRFNKK